MRKLGCCSSVGDSGTLKGTSILSFIHPLARSFASNLEKLTLAPWITQANWPQLAIFCQFHMRCPLSSDRPSCLAQPGLSFIRSLLTERAFYLVHPILFADCNFSDPSPPPPPPKKPRLPLVAAAKCPPGQRMSNPQRCRRFCQTHSKRVIHLSIYLSSSWPVLFALCLHLSLSVGVCQYEHFS